MKGSEGGQPIWAEMRSTILGLDLGPWELGFWEGRLGETRGPGEGGGGKQVRREEGKLGVSDFHNPW